MTKSPSPSGACAAAGMTAAAINATHANTYQDVIAGHRSRAAVGKSRRPPRHATLAPTHARADERTAQAGGFLSSILFGYIVQTYGYDAPFVPMAVLLFLGAALWTQVD